MASRTLVVPPSPKRRGGRGIQSKRSAVNYIVELLAGILHQYLMNISAATSIYVTKYFPSESWHQGLSYADKFVLNKICGGELFTMEVEGETGKIPICPKNEIE